MKAEVDAYGVRKVVADACYLFQDARFEDALRRDVGWREARRLIRARDPFGGLWTARSSGRAMRLARRGVEARLAHGVETRGWKDLQDRLQQRRN